MLNSIQHLPGSATDPAQVQDDLDLSRLPPQH